MKKIDLYYPILTKVMLGKLKIKDILKLAKQSNLLSFILGDAQMLAEMKHRHKIDKAILALPFVHRHPFISFLHEVNQDPHFEAWLDNLIGLSQASPLSVDFLNALYDFTLSTSVEYASEVIDQLKYYDKQQFVSLLAEKKKDYQTQIEQHLATDKPLLVNPKLPTTLRKWSTNQGLPHAHKIICSPQEIKLIAEFIKSIGYEVTSWQPVGSQLEMIHAVPQDIENLLLSLIPHSGITLLNCLKMFALPFDNLNAMRSWLQSLSRLYLYQINHGLIAKHEKSAFFSMMIDLTNKTSLEFASSVMNLFHGKDLVLIDKKDLMTSLKEMGAEHATYVSEKDILKLLKNEEKNTKEREAPEIEFSLSRRMVASQ